MSEGLAQGLYMVEPRAGVCYVTGEGRIERYVKTIQNKYNEVQKMFSPDNFFTGALYSNNVLTLDQLTDIQVSASH